tara:strand:- start:82944 stop:83168 length:225 start_codon:yes stop_codon:yes gene_type:complete
MKTKPLVGSTVRLNDHGMHTIGGLTSMEMIDQARRMIITDVGENITRPEKTYVINVDQPLIDQWLITNHDVDEL